MRRAAMLSALGLLLALGGCSLSSECRKAGPPDSAPYNACISAILQQQNELQNQRDRWDWRGRDNG
ncbi:MAG: hypothetical protein JO081_06715 [Alphaproteobacteria bacterium]|nr:hypothetical protein [Alphaproteobacteria bacterium]